MNNEARSKIINSLMGNESSDDKLNKYFAMNFSVFCSIINLKMVAMLNEKISDGKEPAEDFLKTIMLGWKAAATQQISEELKIFDDMEDDVFGNMIFGVSSSTKEEVKENYMSAMNKFADQIIDTLEK